MPSYIDQQISQSMEVEVSPNDPPPQFGSRDAGTFMKHIDTSFESFFYKREYTEKNFCFYMQVCARQYKSDEALKAFRRMETMGIKPSEHSYNILTLNFAKKRDIDMVMKLQQESLEKYKLLPNKYTYNNLLVCYSKMN